MSILIYELIGIFLIFIEVFIHKHTFVRDYSNTKNWGKFIKIKFPINYLVLYIIFGLIPAINVVTALSLGLMYIARCIDKEGEFIFSFKDVSGQPCEYRPNITINKIRQWFRKDLNR